MQTLRVEGMTGEQCAKTVTEAVRSVEPMAQVEVDVESGTVGFYGVSDLEPVVRAIEAMGYKVKGMA